jgi:hypothetical protein
MSNRNKLTSLIAGRIRRSSFCTHCSPVAASADHPLTGGRTSCHAQLDVARENDAAADAAAVDPRLLAEAAAFVRAWVVSDEQRRRRAMNEPPRMQIVPRPHQD